MVGGCVCVWCGQGSALHKYGSYAAGNSQVYEGRSPRNVGFLLARRGLAGKPHGAEPHHQCWMEGKGVVRGRWHPLPPVTGKWESTFACTVCLDFRLCRQALFLTVCTALGPVSPDLCQGTWAPLQYWWVIPSPVILTLQQSLAT